MIQRLKNLIREIRINYFMQKMVNAKSADDSRRYFQSMKNEIIERHRSTVEKLEDKKGLR